MTAEPEVAQATSDMLAETYGLRIPAARIEDDVTGALFGAMRVAASSANKRKRFMHLAMTPAELALMKRIKHAFDPNDILNPGKVFD